MTTPPDEENKRKKPVRLLATSADSTLTERNNHQLKIKKEKKRENTRTLEKSIIRRVNPIFSFDSIATPPSQPPTLFHSVHTIITNNYFLLDFVLF